jgi:hypothetical protein
MKYTSKIKSEQTVKIDGGKSVVIKPVSGEMSEQDAYAVAKTPWGKRLIETEYLKFEKTIEVKEEKVDHGMTIKPCEKNTGENIPDFDKNGGDA